MDDAYVPALNEFAFTDSESAVIVSALETEKPWTFNANDPLYTPIQAIKMKIQNFHLSRHKNQCCYCRLYLGGGGHFLIDREHILPKSVPIYRHLTYTIWNLGISCKRCNMEYKKERVDFVVDVSDEDALEQSSNYRLIHPNFDNYEDHINHILHQVDGRTIKKYTKNPESNKAGYTYNFFNLRGLEVDCFDEFQGAVDREDTLGEGALQARSIAEDFGQ